VAASDAGDSKVAVAQEPSPLAPALHPDVKLMVEPDRTLVMELTDKRLRRGVLTSVADLTAAITTWAEHWNEEPKPFIWKATAEDIIDKVRRRATLHQIKTQSTATRWALMIATFVMQAPRSQCEPLMS
jgi:hypothetical protein